MSNIRLSESDIFNLTKKKQPRRQLDVLHRLGYSRAILDDEGKVLLETPHFNAVASGSFNAPHNTLTRPKATPIPA